ncbi:gluconate 2-dehydrogenase subunit 3 family protein [Celeribacter marinus]|uniref:gluconate 2-dehydrogenase subunit 3 family protein n=1 Tax=Celeribacter marinus TaxID=1397108 RepID=UPI003F6D5C66
MTSINLTRDAWLKPLRSFQLSRRLVLKLIACAPVLASGAAHAASVSNPDIERLTRLVDVIVPKDETPSASELNVHTYLVTLGDQIDNYALLLREGSAWLEASSQKKFNKAFVTTTASEADQVLRLAMRYPELHLPRVFAARMVQDVLKIYYAIPATWPSLGFDGPIQPAGFSDFESRP